MRRTTATALTAATLILLAACGKSAQTAATGPTATVTAAPASVVPTTPTERSVSPVIFSVAALKSLAGAVRMGATVSVGPAKLEMTGDIDTPCGLMTMKMKSPDGDFELRRTGNDMYLQTKDMDGQWLHIDVRKLKKSGDMYEALNPLANLGVLGGVTAAREVGPGRYEGVVDMAKALTKNALSEAIATEMLKKYESIRELPFEATIDSSGYLTKFTFTMTVPGGDVVADLTLSRVNQPVVVRKPPTNVTIEAPASAYKEL